MNPPINIFWFRRDLRLTDNAGLFHALKDSENVLPLFIFDTGILNKLEDKDDQRVTFIHQTVEKLKTELEKLGSSLLVKHGKPMEIFRQLVDTEKIEGVYTNRDYEPAAIKRDDEIR